MPADLDDPERLTSNFYAMETLRTEIVQLEAVIAIIKSARYTLITQASSGRGCAPASPEPHHSPADLAPASLPWLYTPVDGVDKPFPHLSAPAAIDAARPTSDP
jgi:hypothetical protein